MGRRADGAAHRSDARVDADASRDGDPVRGVANDAVCGADRRGTAAARAPTVRPSASPVAMPYWRARDDGSLGCRRAPRSAAAVSGDRRAPGTGQRRAVSYTY